MKIWKITNKEGQSINVKAKSIEDLKDLLKGFTTDEEDEPSEVVNVVMIDDKFWEE